MGRVHSFLFTFLFIDSEWNKEAIKFCEPYTRNWCMKLFPFILDRIKNSVRFGVLCSYVLGLGLHKNKLRAAAVHTTCFKT